MEDEFGDIPYDDAFTTTTTTLRKRTGKRVEQNLSPVNEEDKNIWGNDGAFYKFQQMLRSKYDVSFENECPDDNGTGISCIVKGYTGNIDSIKELESEEVHFDFSNGNMVLNFTPVSENEKSRRHVKHKRKLLFILFFIVLSLLGLFLSWNYEKYYRMWLTLR